MTRDELVLSTAQQYSANLKNLCDKMANREPEYSDILNAFADGAKWADENPINPQWKDASIIQPPIDEEVIVLLETLSSSYFQISFAHIVDKEICIDYNGWNIKGVKYWISCPQIPQND